ncbi:MAG TPA: ComF family protein [Desulfuromonadales bacterium]|nr:ComF family protein [Desulfuromonadales bacterium]
MKPFLRAILDFLSPPLCHVCRAFIPDAGELHICPACREQLTPVITPLCSVCGIPFDGSGQDHVCGACLTDRPHFDSARAPLLYEGSVRNLIHSFKYDRRTHLRRPLALLIIEHLGTFLNAGRFDMIIPVPLHRSRLRSRGFNQAILLGSLLAERLSLPMPVNLLDRIRKTEQQVDLTAAQRRQNVKGAFAVIVPERVREKRIILLDDVMTTGSTVDECALELKKSGSVGVSVVTIARADR